MPPSVSTGDWDAVVRQIRWCTADRWECRKGRYIALFHWIS